MQGNAITLAGWPLRGCSTDQFLDAITTFRPRMVEFSKDFLRDDVSVKGLAARLAEVRAKNAFDLSYAGTTDLVNCAGMSWQRYRLYVAVQIAQARFLDCTHFRFFLGGTSSDIDIPELICRVLDFSSDLSPMKPCLEIHGGLESDAEVLGALLDRTAVEIVVDVENMHHAGLAFDQMQDLLPTERVAYLHLRNLPGIWVENPTIEADEERWHDLIPGRPVLWEPKTVDDPERILELLREYRASH